MMKFDELTLGEIEEIELLAGAPIDALFADHEPKGRTLRVLAFIIKRRENKNYKFEDTASLTQNEALALLAGDASKKE